MALTKRFYTNHKTVITAENMNDIQDSIIALEALAGIVPGEGEATRNISVVNRNGNFTLVETVGLPDGLYWFDNPVTFKDDTQTETFQLYGLVAKTENGWLNYDNGRSCITDDFGVLIAWTYASLPDVTEESEGKVLTVTDGKWEVADPQQVFPLEEAHVIPTHEPQELLPGNGYCGFSRILVDAAPEGGGDGGSYPGGSGGGGGGSLPDADNSGFGDNYIPEEDGGEVNTGNFFYGTSDTAFPAIPVHPEALYAIVYTKDWKHYEGSELVTTEKTFVTLTAAPLVFNGYSIEGYAHLSYGKSSTNLGNGRIFRDFMAESGGWKFQAEWINHSLYAKKILWVNYTIMMKDEVTPWHPEDSDPVPEKKPGTQAVPAEYEEAYEISGASAYSLMSATQKITGITEPMTPTQAANALVDYYNQPKAEEVLW